MPQPRRGRGCLKGSQNRQYLVDFKEQFIAAIENGIELLMAFITTKEKADFELAKQLWKEGCITTPGAPFQASDKQEIDVVNVNSPKQGYVEQRARGAYIASIYQPEASFNLSVAA